MSSEGTHAPHSLTQPDAATAADRRVIAAATAGNTTPAAVATALSIAKSKVGFATSGHRFLHIHAKASVAGTYLWRLWAYNSVCDEWSLDTRFGTTPVYGVTVTQSAAANPDWKIVQIEGVERVYVEVLTFAGGASADVWLAGAT